jgi:hypothetical protein
VYPRKHLKSLPETLGRNHKYQFYLHPKSGGGRIPVTASLINPYLGRRAAGSSEGTFPCKPGEALERGCG